MEYLKEFQAFAGRFSAAAERRLTRYDGGTYSEFIRFYSEPLPRKAANAADNEQWQIDVLLEELQLATEAPVLFSVPEGTVLHAGSHEPGVADALDRICISLERCVFFGASGPAPDFWRFVGFESGDRTLGGHETGSSVNDKGRDASKVRAPQVEEAGNYSDKEERQQGRRSGLTATVCDLTHVHTGHGRCRAWARGLVALDGDSAEAKLRNAAVVAAASQERSKIAAASIDGSGSASVTQSKGDAADAIDTENGISSDPSEVRSREPDAGGGDSARAKAWLSPTEGGDEEAAAGDNNPTRPVALPLWLRAGSRGRSVLDDMCTSLQDFQERLGDKGLTVRHSLDHAWLDRENVAAATTFTWPGFPKDKLRCHVSGAGVAAADGEYVPAIEDEDMGGELVLIGPKGCRIARQEGKKGMMDSARLRPSSGSVEDESQGEEGDTSESLSVSSVWIERSAPQFSTWCLAIPASQGSELRIAYHCQGNGALPPCRGWKANHAPDGPGPVLVFSSSEGDLGTERNAEGKHASKDGDNHMGEVDRGTFQAAVPASRLEPSTADSLKGNAPGVEASVEVSDRERRRGKKRRRSPQNVAVGPVVIEGGDTGDLHGDQEVAKDSPIACDAGTAACVSEKPPNVGEQSPSEGVDTGESLTVDGVDEACAAFMAERWRLPERTGELLVRTEKIRQEELRIAEERGLLLATRRDSLLQLLARAGRDHEKVLQESPDVTVERILGARESLRETVEAEIDAKNKARGGDGGWLVPSLEELVADKAEELRTRSLKKGTGVEEQSEQHGSRAGSDADEGSKHSDRRSENGVAQQAERTAIDISKLGLPWTNAWLSAPYGLATVVAGEREFLPGTLFEGDLGPEDAEIGDAPPFSLEVAGVEVSDVEESEAAHVEYVLRVTYREVRPVPDVSEQTPGAAEAAGGRTAHDRATACPKEVQASELAELSSASRGLVHRVRVLTKRLNSLCAMHPRLIWELEEGKRLLLPGSGIVNPPSFPDPFELGTLEEDLLRLNREKLTLRFKSSSTERKLAAKMGSYLSGLLYFLGVLEAMGHKELRDRLSRELNAALSTCDRTGRKRASGDLVIGVRLADDPDGKLGSWIDDDTRLKLQKRRCMGCGRAIAAEFLGMKKDYFPCRLANGLFCRSHCHGEGRRVIPHRVVHHWDFAAHRVSNASASFLDATRSLPLIRMQAEASRPVLEQQAFRLVRSRRIQLHLVRSIIVFPPESECASGRLLLEKLLQDRMYLAVDPGLYSVNDLEAVKKGGLVDFLEEALEVMLGHVMEECDTCEARAAHVCSICFSSDPIFVFQTATVAHCSSCDSLFHAKCLIPRGHNSRSASTATTSKWWVDHAEDVKTFNCPRCNASFQMPAGHRD